MDRVFWLYYNINLAQYRSMDRIQQSSHTMDPTVNTYREYLKIVSSNSFGGSSHTSNASGGGSINDTVTHSAPDVIETERTEERGLRHVMENDNFLNRERSVSHDGERIMHREGDGSENYVQDGNGSQEILSRGTKTINTTSQEGRKISLDESNDASRETRADKASPMTSINLSRINGQSGPNEEGNAYVEVANGSLGSQNWSSASAVSEGGRISGSSSRHEEYYDGYKTIVSSVGDINDNVEKRQLQRRQEQGTNITETESYKGYQEVEKISGGEEKERTEDNYEDKIYDKEKRTIGAVVSEKKNSINSNESGSENHNEGSDMEDWTRHTGRDGLTPQDAFRSALKYLADFPDAIYWFISKLEPCFIGVLGSDADDEEEEE